MQSVHLGAFLVVLFSISAHSQNNRRPLPEGRIVGTVIDSDGVPVGGTFVEARAFTPPSTLPEPARIEEPTAAKSELPKQHGKWLEEDVIWPVSYPDAKAREDGTFKIRGLAPGSYALKGEKQDDAYPSADLIFTDGSPAIVTLTAEGPVARVVARMGPKGCLVNGSITDSRTGEPVRAAMRVRVAGKDVLLSSEFPTFKFVMPAPLDAIVILSAEGYKRLAVPVHLEPDQRQVLNLKLEPEAGMPPVPPTVH